MAKAAARLVDDYVVWRWDGAGSNANACDGGCVTVMMRGLQRRGECTVHRGVVEGKETDLTLCACQKR